MKNYSNFVKRSNFVIDCIVREKRSRDDFTYWSLCLDDTRTSPREVDTCATSLCVSILQMYEHIAKANFVSNRDVIQGGINTLLKIRKPNGSWPSVVKPSKILEEYQGTESDVALIDSYFAISVLLDVGFLDKDYEYTKLKDPKMESIDSRVNFVLETVKWLEDITVQNESTGWSNVNNIRGNVSYPDMLATSNVITIFGRVSKSLSILDHNKYKDEIENINNHINKSIDTILMNINEDGGIGAVYSSNSAVLSSLPHTCRLVDILILRNSNDDYDELQNGVNYIIDHCAPEYISTLRKENPDCFCEQYVLNLGSEGEIWIKHENDAECIALITLIEIIKKYHTVKHICNRLIINEAIVIDRIQSLMEALWNRQTKNGKFNGVFKSDIARTDGHHPAYASYYGYSSIVKYMELYNMMNITKSENENNELITKFNIAKYKFEGAINKYGSNDDNKDEMTQLHCFLEKIKNYIPILNGILSDEEKIDMAKELKQMNEYYSQNIGDE